MSFGGSGLALTGNVAVQGNTTLAVQGSGALAFNSAFNNLSTLELKKGVSLNLNSALTTGLHLNGGTAVASGTSSGNKILQGNITITNGGSLTFAGDESVCDTLNHQAMGKSVTVSGGTLDFGTTRQTMGSWELRLSDGAQVLGSGGKYGEKYAAMDFNTNNSTIYATSGSSTISAKTRLRDGNNLNYDVSKDATLTVNGLIHADDVAGKGSITKEGDGTLVLTSANTYANTTTVNAGVLRTSTNGALGTSAVVINGGVLELAPAGGEGVNASILKGAVTVNDGGTLRLGGSDNKVVDTNVTINAGGRMEFTGSGSDMIDYTNGKSKTITVNGGVIDVGTTRQTMQNTALVLKNGAKIEGAGGSYGASYTAGLDYNTASSIVVESGENTIDSNIRIRNVKLTFDVRDDAELALNGRMHYDTNDGKSIVVEKQGGGRMEVNSLVKLATLNPKGGELVLAHTGAQNVLGMLDASQGGTSKGTLSLAQNVDLKVTGKIYGCSTSAIKLESGAQLTSTEDGVIIAHGGGSGSASIVCNASDGEYTVGNADFELTNARLKYDSSVARTLSNKLTNSTIENKNSGGKLLTVDNQHNTLAGVVASRGDINVLNQEALSLNVLEVATGKSVGMYTGGNTSSAKAAVAVSSSAVFGAGAALSTASLTLADGATLEMTGTVDAVQLNGAALTFGSGVQLGDNLLAAMQALEYGETLALFSGVGEFNMPVVAAAAELESSRVLANTVFSNVLSESLYVEYRVEDNVGSLLVVNVPEPATTTLSLLALSALAARRRRK
jgi:autotransporter-associated beta strand protein